MDTTLKLYQKKAIEALQQYRNEILKEFLLASKKMCNEIDALCSTGVDKKRYICLEGVEVEQDICYTVLSRVEILAISAALKNNDNEVIERFREITEKFDTKDLYEYDEFCKMEDLASKDKDAQLAQNMIE